jgi:hypothetical protein
MEKDYIWENLADALMFAFRFSSQQYAKVQKVDPTPLGNGLGLIGIDGAAQAGFIAYMAFELGKVKEAALVARFGSPYDEDAGRCECCGRAELSDGFRGSCVLLATNIAMPAAETIHERMARELVMRHFLPSTAKRTFASIATQFSEGEDKVKKAFYKVANALKTLESQAQANMADVLCESGVVKSSVGKTHKKAA